MELDYCFLTHGVHEIAIAENLLSILCFVFITTHEAAVLLIRMVVSVCLYVSNALSFERRPRKFSFGEQVRDLQGIKVKFIYEGHRFKVKVIGAKSVNVITPLPGLSKSMTATAVTAISFT